MKLYVARNDKIYDGWTGEQLEATMLSDELTHAEECMINVLARYDCDCYVSKVVQLEAALQERTSQYHLAHAKILSREAINEDLGEDYNALVRYARALQRARILPSSYNVKAADVAYQVLSDKTQKRLDE